MIVGERVVSVRLLDTWKKRQFIQRNIIQEYLRNTPKNKEVTLLNIHHTPLKLNMEPENQPLGPRKGDSFRKPSFSGSMLHFGDVSKRESCILTPFLRSEDIPKVGKLVFPGASS